MTKISKTKKTALITGGAKRIGKAICLSLSEQGYNIALHYHRSKDDAKKIADHIHQRGGTCKLFSCDLSDPKQVGQLIPDVIKRFARLDILVNNASIFKKSTIKNSSMASLHEHFSVNFEAPYQLTTRFAHQCKKGHIINILDTHIINHSTQYAAYLLSKKALHELTKIAAVELAPHIRVNGIAPGLILPPERSKTGHLNRLAKNIPLKKKGNVDQITGTVQFLLSNPYITGQVIFTDGGEHLV
jgi:NAD(P)-dependent dehydrogenase (short-subunit alcohol dehydrogenase family)